MDNFRTVGKTGLFENPLLAHLSRVIRVYAGIGVLQPSGNVVSTFSNDFYSEAVRPILLIFHIHHLYVGHDGGGGGGGGRIILFLFQSDKTSVCYSNLQFP